jgi:DNA-binding PadR family transcriptional regulator
MSDVATDFEVRLVQSFMDVIVRAFIVDIPNLNLYQTIFGTAFRQHQGLVRDLEREVVNKMYERFLREFMDILIMVKMRQGETSGYDLLNYFHEQFDLLVSPGTVYSVLYSMERDGLIKARGVDRKRIYTLAPKGEATIKAIRESTEVLEGFLRRLLKESVPMRH